MAANNATWKIRDKKYRDGPAYKVVVRVGPNDFEDRKFGNDKAKLEEYALEISKNNPRRSVFVCRSGFIF